VPDSPSLALYADRFFISPYVYTCHVALQEKGLPFELVEVALDRQEQHGAEYRDRTLTGRVPALRHDDFWLAESTAIVEYLEENFGGPTLFPKDPKDRARARQILGWVRSDLMALREERSTHTMFYAPTAAPLSEKAQIAADKLVRVASALVRDGQTTLFGSWSIADADLSFMLHRLLANDDPVPAGLRAYAEATWRRPSVRAFVERERAVYVPY
jgi:glutathione S-transferase